jgi:hypothetical protein
MFDRYSARDIDTLIDATQNIDTLLDTVQKIEALFDVMRNEINGVRLIKHCLLDVREERHLREAYPQTEDY